MKPVVCHEEEGIVLRRSRFAESSLVVTWMTPGRGKLKTAARSALKPGTAFSGRVELFHVARFSWQEATRGEIHTLREVELVQGFLPPEGEAHRALQAASYFAALIEKIVPPDAPAPEIFDLLRRALLYLNRGPGDRKAVLFFEQELARLLGILNPGDSAGAVAELRSYAGGLPPGREELLGNF